MNLDSSVQYLKGVGPKMAEKLKRLGIEEVRDLIFYYPFRYDDFSRYRTIKSLRINEIAVIKGKILSVKKLYTKRKWMTLVEAEIEDNTSKIKAIWYNQPYLLKILKTNEEWYFQGKVSFDFKNKNKTFSVFQFEKNPEILPIYYETAGITSKYLRKLIKPLLTSNDTSEVPFNSRKIIKEYIPKEILSTENLIGLSDTIRKIHLPNSQNDIKMARQRIAFDELFFLFLRILINKKELSKIKAISLVFDKKKIKEFVAKLPFKLTNAQRKVAWEIICDLAKTKPMSRLLMGDVGSGKTIVALLGALVAMQNKMQTVWLAPTEVLASQHYANINKLTKNIKIKIGLWTSSSKKSNLTKDDIIIGTHALLQKNITFSKLGLIIVDEQHRFGVKQRACLREGTVPSERTVLGPVPHFLSMTATPIPRTLALTYYGDLDLSIIDELPVGRKKIITKIIIPKERKSAYDFIKKEIINGRQAFVICPLIEMQKSNIKMQNENQNNKIIKSQRELFNLDRKSVIEEYKKLSKEIFPKLKIGLLHGKMKSKEKQEIMQKFKENKINILVSTAVIEVGIDIPNATVMMIENADRFGLAQLHQFRGRVGRSEHQSYCLLFSENWSQVSKKRLMAMTKCDNGFELAQIDLELRGPGEFSGIRQSGIPDLKMASITDKIMLEKSRKVAEKIITNGLEKYPTLNKKIQEMISSKHME